MDGRPARDAYARFAGLGFQFAGTIGVFAWGGYWLDGKFGTRPILLLVGVLLGFVGAMISIVRQLPPAGGGKPADTNADTTDR